MAVITETGLKHCQHTLRVEIQNNNSNQYQ